MIFSFIKPLVKYTAMLIVVVFGAMICALIATIPIRLNPAMPSLLRTLGFWISVLCFGVGMLDLVFRRSTQVMKQSGKIGVAVPFAVLIISIPITLIEVALRIVDPITLASMVVMAVVCIMFLYDDIVARVNKLRGMTSGESGTYSNPSTSAKSRSLSGNAIAKQSDNIRVGAFEVVECPVDYIAGASTTDRQELYEPFHTLVRGMTGSRAPLGLRLERIEGRTREFFLTAGLTAADLTRNMDLLERILAGNLPRFGFKRHNRFAGLTAKTGMTGALAHLTGEPLSVADTRQRVDPLTVFAESFQHLEDGIMQVFATPAPQGVVRSLTRAWKGRQYQNKAQQATKTVSKKSSGLFSGGSEESVTTVNVAAASEADRLNREVQRYRAENACELEVIVGCWDDSRRNATQEAYTLMEALRGAVVPADVERDLKITTSKKTEDFQKLVDGKPVGVSTLLVPEEASMLLTMPRCDLGIVTSRRESFSTATTPVPAPLEGAISPGKGSAEQFQKPGRSRYAMKQPYPNRRGGVILGNPIRKSGDAIASKFIWFRRQQFESHIGIYGNTRSGKTTTALSIAAQAINCGIRTLMLIPRKGGDWVRLSYMKPETWVFTAGNPGGTQFRKNIFIPPTGVQLTRWIAELVKIFSAWLPNDRVMSMHFDDIFHTIYRNCGWNQDTNMHGRPPLLKDFWDAVEEVCVDIQYGDELKSNFYGALYSRMSSMLRNHGIVDMYNTTEGITWEELVENDVIIIMEDLPEPDMALLTSILLAGIHLYKMVHPTEKITNLVVLEEASYLLKRSTGQDIYGPNVHEVMSEGIVDMFTTGGGNGLGCMVIEQLPVRLAEAILKLVVNVIVHAMADEDERKLVGGHIGVNEKQLDHLRQMRKGETVVHLEGQGVPQSVKIRPLDFFLEAPLPKKPMTNGMIRDAMKPIYEKHPNLVSVEELPKEIIARIERAKPGATGSTKEVGRKPIHPSSERKLDPDTKTRLSHLAENHRFSKCYYESLREAASSDSTSFVDLMATAVKKASPEGADLSALAEWFIPHVRNVLGAPDDGTLFNDLAARVREKVTV